MERCGFVPELIFWNSFEEQMQFEETNTMPPLLDLIEEQRCGNMSMIWPDHYNGGGNDVFCSLDDQNVSYDQSTNDRVMEDEQFAASFIQIDAAYQFEGLLSPNEASSHDFTCKPWINAAPEECNNFDVVAAAGSRKKKAELSSTIQKSAKKLRSKKKKSSEAGHDQEVICNAGLNMQSTSGCSSDEDHLLNGSQESNEGGSTSSGSKRSAALNITGKARAERGGATDPQSLYARKRRERINERLRILQNLVPNGTKVDISTMLEEAVQYVKFLQLQIQLLSSDKLWKYAPLAYNGMNVELASMIRATKQ